MFRSGSVGVADHQSSKSEKETRKIGKCLDKKHKHYSNSDILCLMAKYSLGLIIFKQFGKVFFICFSRY